MADKFKKLKRQVSTDGGFTWTDLIPYEYIAGELIQRDSPDCNNIEWRTVSGYICEGNTTEMTQWVEDTGYVCVGFDKYNKEKEQISYNSGISWSDTGNTRAGSTLIEQNSEDCGYVPPITRWVADTGYMCVGTDKYSKEKEQQSTDGGTTWTDTGNTRAGSTLIEANSTDCGYIEPIYQWVNVSGEYACVGYDKYNKEKKQISYDSGSTWEDTGETRAGSTLIEHDSEDCGYSPHDYSKEYLTTEALGDGIICLKIGMTYGPLTNIQYSKNGGAWTSYTYGYNISVATGDKIRWKGTEVRHVNEGDYNNFFATADYKVYGNPLSLLNNDSFIGEPDAIQEYAYYCLFHNSSTLKDASNLALPATILTEGCYEYMFEGCTSLTTAPALPATTMAKQCYDRMFQGCTSLATAPAILPATTLADYCYFCMFSGCTSLTTAPAILPATTLADDCYYYMFAGCTSLTTAPVLPATTLADYCYSGMFKDCTSLTTAPALPATTLETQCYYGMFSGCTSLTTAPAILPATTLTQSCYYGMFSGCTSLTTAPELPATTLTVGCYISMFRDCTSLNYIKCLASRISEAQNTDRWVKNVASSGTFVKASSMRNWPRNENGIPTGWTIQNA